MALNNANNRVPLEVGVGTQAATVTLPAGHFERRTALKAAYLQNGAAEAHNGTNYVKVALQIVGGAIIALFDGSVASVTPGDGKGDLAADVASLMAPQVPALPGSNGGLYTGQSAPNAYPVEIPAGSDLQVVVTVGGSGSTTNAKVILESFEL